MCLWQPGDIFVAEVISLSDTMVLCHFVQHTNCIESFTPSDQLKRHIAEYDEDTSQSTMNVTAWVHDLDNAGHHETRARRRTRTNGVLPKPAARPSPHLWRRRWFRRQTIEGPARPRLRLRACHRQLTTPQLTCNGGINGRQTVPRAELQAFLYFLQRTTGPATYMCDATAVSKGFHRLRAGHDMVSSGNHDIWTAIRAAADQRDVQVHWIASHEEDTMHGLVHRFEHVGRRRGRDRGRPLRLP